MMILLSILAVLLVLAGSPIRAERPGWHGFEPAVLIQQPEFDRLAAIPSITFTREIEMIVGIDERGKITSARPAHSTDSMMVASLVPQLQRVELEPARLDGRAVASFLATRFLVAPRMQYPAVRFPIGPDGSVTNPELCRETYRLNGMEPSELVHFPSYFYLDNSRDSLGKSVPGVLFRLEFDHTGQIVSSDKQFSSAPGFDRQLDAALLRASFLPAKRNDTAVSSVAWLVVSFYPNVTHPTQVWSKSASGEQSFLDQMRLRLLPDTLGFMQLPIPRRPQHEFFSLRGDHIYERDTVAVTLLIDTLGQVRVTNSDRARPAVRAAMRRVAAAVEFHPAVGFDGHPRSFSGQAFYEFTGRNTIRIRYAWLPQPITPASDL